MNTTDYTAEANSNWDCYQTPDRDLTNQFNTYNHHLINQAQRLNIIDDSIKDNWQMNNLRISKFYPCSMIHKQKTPGRPIMKVIGSITKKISAYVDL